MELAISRSQVWRFDQLHHSIHLSAQAGYLNTGVVDGVIKKVHNIQDTVSDLNPLPYVINQNQFSSLRMSVHPKIAPV
jgi:hypothetical protein